MTLTMLLLSPMRTVSVVCRRSYKNFGHKREPIPGITTLWHGFLTFTFVGMCLNWDKIGTWIFGESDKKNEELDSKTDKVS